MAFDLSPLHITGLAAGAAVIGLGVFVVLAQPRAIASRAFFLLALADGTSSVLFELRDMADTAAQRTYFMATYEYFFIIFVALLAGFGLLVPKPFRSKRARRILAGALVVATIGTLLAYAVDHAWFWYVQARPDGGVSFRQGPAGYAITVAYALFTGIVLVRLTRTVLVADGTVRRQAAFILGGMALGYGSIFASPVIGSAQVGFPQFTSPIPGQRVLYASFALVSLVLVLCGAALVHRRDALDRDVRRFLLSALAGVVVLTFFSVFVPGSFAFVQGTVQVLALLAYPLLLGYAILRFAVFDIDAKLRRAASLTLATVALSMVFVTTENMLANFVQDKFQGFISSSVVASVVAGLVAAALVLPVIRATEKFARRVVPTLTHDELNERKREIYRHSLTGALADGLLDERESQTLARLREVLGISAEEHSTLVADIQRARAA